MRPSSRPRALQRGWLLAASACLAALPVQADDLRGFVLAGACLICHGQPASNGIPSLAGRSAAELRTALREFRAGTRPSTVMQRLAAGYDDAEIELIAAWLAAAGD